MNQPQHDPDPVWDMGPLPDPRPALTAEEQADLADYDAYVHSMQTTGIDQRVESDPNWTSPRAAWEAGRLAENEAEAEAEP